MFEKIKSYKLASTASNLFDNLDILIDTNTKKLLFDRLSIACISQFQVSLLHFSHGMSSTSKVMIEKCESSKINITNAKWCRLLNQDVLVVASQEGTLIYDNKGQVMLYWHGIQASSVNNNPDLLCCGIACVEQKFICVGTSSGKVLVFTTHKNSFNLRHTITVGKRSGISSISATNLSSSKVNCAISNQDGSIFCYKITQENFSSVSETQLDGTPCTSVKLANDEILAAGYLMGFIKIINPISGVVLAHINAHSRIITSIDIIQSDKDVHLISASEDSFIRIWKITPGNNLEVQQIWYHIIQDEQPCGVRFYDKKSFLVSCYDNRNVSHFSRKQF